MANKDCELAIGWNRFNLEILGLWPEPSAADNAFTNYRFIIPALSIGVFICLPQTLALYVVWGNVNVFCEILSAAWFPVTNSIIKLLIVRYRREALRSLLQSFYEDWNSSYSQEAQKVMQDGAKRARTVSVWCTIVTHTLILVYLLMRVVQILGTDRDTNDQLHLLIYKGYIPVDMKSTTMLVLGNLGQIASVFSGNTCYIGVDSFLCMLVVHACAQFSTLELRLASLFRETRLRHSNEVFRKELGSITKKHERLIWYVNTLEECFNFFMLFQMLLYTLQICIVIFYGLSIFKSGTGSLFLYLFNVFLAAFIVSHIYIYCYMGEMLLIQNTKMADSAYDAEWYNAQSFEAKNIMILMCRSTIPLRFTAGKFGTFSMEMFGGILRTALGYLSVLLTVANFGD